MQVRVNKYLAQNGVGARRKVEQLILQKRITINDVVANLGDIVDSDKDIVKVDGQTVVKNSTFTYFLLNKPAGVLSTVKDTHDRETVLDLVNVPDKVFPVGRLDYMSTGLILLTNNGELAYKMTHPKFHIPKTYLVKTKETISEKALDIIRKGNIQIDKKLTSQADIKRINPYTFEITIYEGIKRQVRESCKFVGLTVLDLKRIKVGKIELGNLPLGEYRELTKKEVDYILSI